MNRRFIGLLFPVQLCFLSAIAQEPQQKSPGPTKPSQHPAQAPTVKARQPSPEMQKLFSAFLGTWSVTEKYEQSETMPNGDVGEGEEVYRSGPGGAQ